MNEYPMVVLSTDHFASLPNGTYAILELAEDLANAQWIARRAIITSNARLKWDLAAAEKHSFGVHLGTRIGVVQIMTGPFAHINMCGKSDSPFGEALLVTSSQPLIRLLSKAVREQLGIKAPNKHRRQRRV